MVPICLARPRRFTLAARAPAGIMALEVGLLLSPAFLAAFIGPSFCRSVEKIGGLSRR